MRQVINNKFASGYYFDYLTMDENTLEKGLYYENVRCKFDSKACIPSIIYGIEQYLPYPSETSRIQYISCTVADLILNCASVCDTQTDNDHIYLKFYKFQYKPEFKIYKYVEKLFELNSEHITNLGGNFIYHFPSDILDLYLDEKEKIKLKDSVSYDDTDLSRCLNKYTNLKEKTAHKFLFKIKKLKSENKSLYQRLMKLIDSEINYHQ